MSIKFSIIIPTLNSHKTLSKCIKSVISQTYTNWEIIIVDASENDRCARICKKFDLKEKLIFNKSFKKKGLAYDRLIGIKNARGKYVSFLDSDDIWLKNKLKNQYECIKKYKIKFLCSNYYIVSENKIKYASSYNKNFFNFNFLLKNRPISNSAATVERNLILKVATKYNANIFAEDFLWWSIILKKYYPKCYLVKSHDVVNLYSSNSRSKNIINNYHGVFNIYTKYLNISAFTTIYFFFLLSINTFRKNFLKFSLFLK